MIKMDDRQFCILYYVSDNCIGNVLVVVVIVVRRV